ncbi:HAD family hydrolase [Ostreibacterium oceani]|uniref:HAD-IA family hydrolase n=1 Tax=Ostreibacterium oceani TaxID=2654998 RepID=A0A6N7EW07_9GAMM|nr:HAD-IA family hydrolase [Ostreibacterium oceani]MPV86682.1 HAD-IA family hydrolase [Ostreibacterium oceani]
MQRFDAILFDLDGTLIDSAPDLIQTLNDLLTHYQRPLVASELLRQQVSYGSTRLLEIGFAGDYPTPDFHTLRREYLDRYLTQNTVHTTYFDEVEDLLTRIESSNLPWGIVTNKPTDCTTAIVEKLGISQRAQAIVCGDTLPVAKPDPSPIYLACKMMDVDPKRCVYVGDCIRDIEAGRNADMSTIACAYGYIGADIPISEWQAEHIANTPLQILDYL